MRAEIRRCEEQGRFSDVGEDRRLCDISVFSHHFEWQIPKADIDTSLLHQCDNRYWRIKRSISKVQISELEIIDFESVEVFQEFGNFCDVLQGEMVDVLH